MFGISFAELAIVFLLVLLVMGPEKLPQVARWAGKGMREIRQASNTLRNALMVEDFDGGNSTKKTIETSARRSKSSANQATQTPPTPKKAPSSARDSTNAPAATDPVSSPEEQPSLPGSGLDQVDDDAFDQMLEDHYRIHRTELHDVAMADALPTDEVVAVTIEAPNTAADEMVMISMTTSLNAGVPS